MICSECEKRPVKAMGLCGACYKRLVWRPRNTVAVERERARAREWKASHRGTCLDCGTQTWASDNLRCHRCNVAFQVATEARKTWTRDRIVAAIRDWVEIHGRVPRVVDWNPSLARERGIAHAADEYLAEPERWPHFHTVHREFGTWRAGIKAAGFEPRGQGRNLSCPGPTAEQLAEAARLYRSGLTCRGVGVELGVCSETARRWLALAGVPRRIGRTAWRQAA